MSHHNLFDATLWINSGIKQDQTSQNYSNFDDVSYRISYNTNLDKFALRTKIYLKSSFISGLHKNNISLIKEDIKGKNKLYISIKSLYRPINSSENYIIDNSWNKGYFNNRIDILVEHKYKYSHGKGQVHLNLKSTTLGSNYDYSIISLKTINKNKYDRIKVNSRGYIQYGVGENWAPESRLGLSGSNPEELSDNKFTRTNGILNNDHLGFSNSLGNFQIGGGLNLRGYNGYIAPEYDNEGNLIKNSNYGTSGASFTTEIDFTSFLPRHLIKKGLGTYLFADAGIINTEEINRDNYKTAWTDLRADAGIGFLYTHRDWGPLETISPLIIRLDFPFFINRPVEEEEYTEFRWLIGIGKSF